MKLTKKLSLVALLMSTAAPAFALEEGKLVIWMGADKGNEQLQGVVDAFTADLGVEVVVEVVDPLTDKFQQAAATGDGPDIVLWAHDRFGEWAAGGLIQRRMGMPDATVLVLQGLMFVVLLVSETLYGRLSFFRPKGNLQ